MNERYNGTERSRYYSLSLWLHLLYIGDHHTNIPQRERVADFKSTRVKMDTISAIRLQTALSSKPLKSIVNSSRRHVTDKLQENAFMGR